MNCKQCGYCCTLVPVITFTEMLRIKLKGYSHFTDKDVKGRKCIKLINGDCIFLKRDENKTRCSIYNIRPKVCRNFPVKDATECNIEKKTLKERIIN